MSDRLSNKPVNVDSKIKRMKVIELQPAVDRNRGNTADVLVQKYFLATKMESVYIGDDLTAMDFLGK